MPRAGEDDLNVRVEVAAGFEQRELCGAVLSKVTLRVTHRIDMTGATCQVENHVNPADKMIDDVIISDVSGMNFDLMRDAIEVKMIAALIRHECINDLHFHVADFDEPTREIATDEAESTRDEYGATAIFVE